MRIFREKAAILLLASTGLALTLPFLTASPAHSAIDHEVILKDRLSDVRERLDRRQAHRSMLNRQIERFGLELDRLQKERKAAQKAVADQADRARALERQLDRLVPRLLPRLKVLDRMRKNGAHAIAGLATMERRSELEDRARSRLMATQTASIEQMRLASTAVRLLRRAPNALTARHRDIDFQIPLLEASASRLDLRQSQLQRRRDRAIRELADLTVDVERLTTEEHRLAGHLLARRLEATGGVDVAPDSLKAVLLDRRDVGKSSIGSARVRGIALRQTQPTPIARPLDGIAASIGRTSIAVDVRDDGSITAKAEASALLAGLAAHHDSDGLNASAPSSSSLTARVGTSVIRPDGSEGGTAGDGPALVAAIKSNDGTSVEGDRPEIQIAALPRQRVAAADDGIVAFAGDFRSYGLLLIIEHGNGYHTLLWGFSSLDVRFGDTVRAGEIVGIMKDDPSPKLHIELRRNGQPVSPEVWLAASNSGVKG